MTATVIENTSVDTSFNINELTQGTLTGTGVFDVLLQTMRVHLDREFKEGRITGTAYATVYSQSISSFLQQAVQFSLSKSKLALELQQMKEQVTLLQLQQDQITAQTSLVTKQELNTIQQTSNLASQQSQIEAETDKLLYEATYIMPENKKVIEYTQSRILAETNKISNETVVTIKQGKLTEAQRLQVTAQTDLLAYDLVSVKPMEVANIVKQGDLLGTQIDESVARTSQITYTVANILPKQVLLTQAQIDAASAQIEQVTAQTTQVTYTTANLLPAQVTNTSAQTANTTAQTDLYAQKKVTELAQTTSTPAAGSVMGVQNALMAQQQENYLRDAEQKAAKIMIETWAVRQNTDGGAGIDTNGLSNANINTAVTALLAGI